MKVQEQFLVPEAVGTVWHFLEQVDRVARCVPGVEEVTVVDQDNSRVRVTQSVGPMTATFDMKMRITAREPGRLLEFTAIGRTVRGAAGNVRATNRVHLEDAEEGSTRVLLEGEVALGGMLGSVGQKVVAKQAAEVTRAFAQALQAELSAQSDGPAAAPGAPEAPAEFSARAAASQPAASGPLAGAGTAPGGIAGPRLLMTIAALALCLLIIRRRWSSR